jgi:hypothetical protein
LRSHSEEGAGTMELASKETKGILILHRRYEGSLHLHIVGKAGRGKGRIC